MGHHQATLEYKSKDGTTFTFRAEATKRDKSDLNVFTGEHTRVIDGKEIRVNISALFPWMFERFVVGWSGGAQVNGAAILNALYDQPADPEEDPIMVVGAYIYNHVTGLQKTDESKKKD